MSPDEAADFSHSGMAIAAERYLRRSQEQLEGDGRLGGVELIATVPMDVGSAGGVLWLGGWCEGARGDLDVVLPNPWDDRAAIDVFEDGCWRATQWLASELAPRFNQLHDLDLPPAYWDVLATPWLLHLVSVVAERYLRLTTALRLVPAGAILAGPPAAAPRNGAEAVDSYISDAGNLEVCSRIALALGCPTRQPDAERVLPSPPMSPQSASKTGRASVLRQRAALREALKSRVSRLVHSRLRGREVLLLAVPFGSPLQVGRLRQRVSGLRAGSLHEYANPSGSPARPSFNDPAARSILVEGITAPGKLEALLLELLPDLTPRSLVEDYQEVARLSRARYGPPCPTVIGNYWVDEPQNEFLGRVAASGQGIAFAQHGGSYRQSRVDGIERLEVRSGGTFLSWGWQGSGARVAASPKLARLKDTHSGGDEVLLIEVQLPRYVLRFNTWPLAEQTQRLPLDLGTFVREATTRGLASHLLLKPATDNDSYGHARSGDVDALPRTNSAISPYATDWMKQARVAVVTYPATSLIEAMVIGVPMIGLWDRAYWEERDDAREHFERLEQLGVLFSDAAEAAERLSEVYDHATEWWLGRDIQRARSAFLQRFGRTDSWLADWTGALVELRRTGQPSSVRAPRDSTRR